MQQFEGMIKWEIIEKRHRQNVTSLVVVKKKCGSQRICIDARHLNSRMEKDNVVLSNPYELLCKFTPGQYLTLLNLSSSYWQIRIKAYDQYTGFCFKRETYVFLR